jgi:hypothetical protein
MGNHLIAKNRIKALTTRIERDIYILKYGGEEFDEMDDDLYVYIYAICLDKDCFPLVRHNGNVYLNGSTPLLYSTLLRLADDYGIKLDYKKLL